MTPHWSTTFATGDILLNRSYVAFLVPTTMAWAREILMHTHRIEKQSRKDLYVHYMGEAENTLTSPANSTAESDNHATKVMAGPTDRAAHPPTT